MRLAVGVLAERLGVLGDPLAHRLHRQGAGGGWQQLVQEHIPSAGLRQLPRQPLQLLLHPAMRVWLQQTFEQAKRRAEPANGDPELMHGLRVAAVDGRSPIRRQLLEAGGEDALGHRLDGLRIGEFDGVRSDRSIGFSQIEREAPRRLAFKLEPERHVAGERLRQLEQLQWLARLELELELADGPRPRLGLDLADVEVDRNLAAAPPPQQPQV